MKSKFKFFITMLIVFSASAVHAEKNVLIMTISDVSKRCPSNEFRIYSNGEYRVYRSFRKNLNDFEKGYLNYNKDFNALVNKIRTYKIDKNDFRHYKIVLSNNEIIYTSEKTNAPELKELIASIPLENPFWCGACGNNK